VEGEDAELGLDLGRQLALAGRRGAVLAAGSSGAGPHLGRLITLEPHPSEEWTERAAAGMKSQLTKLPASLATRRKRPDGQRRLYSLRPEPFRELEAWLASYRSLWEARLDRFGQAVERKRRSRAAKHNHREKKK
jgi:hypothetical protein